MASRNDLRGLVTCPAVPLEIVSGSASCALSGLAALIGAIANPSGHGRSDTSPQQEAWIADCRAAAREALRRETDVGRRARLGISPILLGDQVPAAFAAKGPTRLPLNRLQEFAQRAANGLTERKHALDFIFELALSEIDIDTILEWLDDRERWGSEDDI